MFDLLVEEYFKRPGFNCSEALPRPCSRHVDYVMNVYLFTTITCVGVVTNILNLTVFVDRKSKLNGTTFTLLKALATADFFVCVMCVPAGISRCVPYRHHWEIALRQVYEIYILIPVSNSFAAASGWLTVILAVERYIAVRFLNGPSFRRISTWVCIILTYLCAFAINVPYFWYREPNYDGIYPKLTRFGVSDGFNIYLWVRMILMKGVPIVFILIFNGLLVHAVHVANQRRKALVFQNTSDCRRQHLQLRITAMMIGITITFLVCHVVEPFSHGSVYRAIHGPCSLRTDQYMTQRVVTNNLELLSYSTNFIFYSIFHKQFRASLRRLFHCTACCGDLPDDLEKSAATRTASTFRGNRKSSTKVGPISDQ